jgi:hypothetical protein
MLFWLIIIFLALYIFGLYRLAYYFYQKGKKMPYQPRQPVNSFLKRIYIICPVRGLTEEEKIKILDYAFQKEKEGYIVRCPFRDTNQNDEIGLRIVEEHEKDILWADEIHIFWNLQSQGSLWDFAQARMARYFQPEKKFVLINLEQLEVTKEKSYQNVLLATCFGLDSNAKLEDLKKILEIKKSA